MRNGHEPNEKEKAVAGQRTIRQRETQKGTPLSKSTDLANFDSAREEKG